MSDRDEDWRSKRYDEHDSSVVHGYCGSKEKREIEQHRKDEQKKAQAQYEKGQRQRERRRKHQQRTLRYKTATEFFDDCDRPANNYIAATAVSERAVFKSNKWMTVMDYAMVLHSRDALQLDIALTKKKETQRQLERLPDSETAPVTIYQVSAKLCVDEAVVENMNAAYDQDMLPGPEVMMECDIAVPSDGFFRLIEDQTATPMRAVLVAPSESKAIYTEKRSAGESEYATGDYQIASPPTTHRYPIAVNRN